MHLTYNLKTDYKCLSHRHEVFPTIGLSTENLINLVQQSSLSATGLEMKYLPTFVKLL